MTHLHSMVRFVGMMLFTTSNPPLCILVNILFFYHYILEYGIFNNNTSNCPCQDLVGKAGTTVIFVSYIRI